MAGRRFGRADIVIISGLYLLQRERATSRVGVRSAVAAPSCTRGETADAAASEAAAARHGGSSPPGCTNLACAQRPRHRSYIRHPSQSWREHNASLSGQGIGPTYRHSAGSSPASEHQHFSRSSKAERPADNRKTAVRYRAGEPSHEQEITMTTITKPGRLAAASPSLTDPERSSLRRLGNGLLIRAPEVQLLPGPPTASHMHTTSSIG